LEKNATKDNFRKIMRLLAGEKLPDSESKEIPNAQRIAKATPEDTVLIFYSSHGYRDRERFYLFPYDIGSGSGRDPEAVAQGAVEVHHRNSTRSSAAAQPAQSNARISAGDRAGMGEFA